MHAGPLRPLQTALDAALAEVGAPSAGRLLDQIAASDHVFQLSTPGLEYPRRELPSSVEFVGPLRPTTTPTAGDLPPWWDDLDGARPVVHVTQGTLDNADLGRLVIPTLRALADEAVLVVAVTGGRPVKAVTDAFAGCLPANARVAEFLPYDVLLPRTDVYVTNGGFGGVQLALAHGLPLVVAGSTEDKPEVAARVAWAGAGVNLRTGTPRPARIRAAVRSALTETSYREAAGRLAAESAELGDPVATIAATIRDLLHPTASSAVGHA